MTTLQTFFTSPEGLAIYGVLIITAADFLLGVAAAFRDSTFQLDSIAAYLRKHIMGRVFPIAALLALGYFGQQPALSALGAASAAAYLAETLGSIGDSWAPGHDEQAVPED